MNNLGWKYGTVVAECKCNKPHRLVHFTTLCPMSLPVTANDYKLYHNDIDTVAQKLQCLGFEFALGSVILISHSVVTKESIEKILGQNLL